MNVNTYCEGYHMWDSLSTHFDKQHIVSRSESVLNVDVETPKIENETTLFRRTQIHQHGEHLLNFHHCEKNKIQKNETIFSWIQTDCKCENIVAQRAAAARSAACNS